MSNMPFTATIRPGVQTSVTTVNVRNGPGTNFGVIMQAPTGLDNLLVQNVAPDSRDTRFGSQVYQWFELSFPDNTTGWVRDDLLDVTGDGTPFGYGVVMGKAFALELNRAEPDTQRSNRPTNPTEESPLVSPSNLPPHLADRVIRAGYNITAGFEGSGYASYQTYDRGLISYGRFQFTLASGSLARVLQRYIELSPERTADTIKKTYLQRVKDRDATLRDDRRFKMLLQHAATLPDMQIAQDEIAFTEYWQVVHDLSIVPRGIQLPLMRAMAFDIGIQHGPRHDIFGTVERQLGVASRSKVSNEREFAKRSAQVRRQILYRIADQQGLPGVKRRADFWVNLIQAGDWDLQGDNKGNVEILGRKVQIGKI